MTGNYIDHQLKIGQTWLKNRMIFDQFRFRYYSPTPRKNKVVYPFFGMVKIENGRQNIIAKGESVEDLIRAFESMYVIE